MSKAPRFVLSGIALFLGSTIVMLPPSTVAQITLGKVGGNPTRAQTPPKSPPPPPPSGIVQFQDVTDQVGMSTQALKWGDIAVGDYDNSGWDSVYLGHHGICNTAVGQPCTIGGVDGSQTWPKGGQLFHNNQNGTFSEATALLPDVTDTTQHRHIALWCDVEGTGYEDLILGTGFRSDTTDVTGVNDLWLHNTGAGFTDIAAQLGTTDLLSKVGAMTCGRLVSPTGPDVVLANWDPSPPLGEQPLHHLWVNFGTTFQEQGAQRGLTVTSNYYSHAVPYGLACADFRRQGAMDCLVSGINDSVWFLNRRDGTFDVTGGRYRTDIAELSPYNHDAYFADFTGHGLLDVAVADVQVNAVRILCNDGTTIIAECGRIPAPAGPSAELRSLAVGDFDNSGSPSIFVLMSGGCNQDGLLCKGPDMLLMNDGQGNFTDQATQAGLNQFVGTRYGAGGAAVIDYDMDGQLDLIVGYNEDGSPGPFRIYRNVTQTGNSWIGFRLRGPNAIGSWVTITACGKSQVQQLTARTGWVHQSSRVVHFGLGQCAGPVDASTSWPTGQVARFTLAANAYYTMTPTGQPKALLSTGKRLSAKR